MMLLLLLALLALLALPAFVAVAAVGMSTSPIGRHRGARRLVSAGPGRRGPARHRR
ncbi:hypothetical protein ACFZCK_00150 [Kitasatospora purpeofusca]|uniref:hypothetical protein n=1 Tax=Kitasatospora purpeofusca TaxID=67352 RepID=UPI0036E938B1